MMRIAALASHGGSILQAVIDACEAGSLPAEVSLVISNNSQSGALARARSHGISTAHLSSRTHPDPDALDEAIEQALIDADADWVLLSGYMKKLGPRTLARYRNRILNTHPALLPRYGGQGFYGSRVHAAVIEAGDKESGATVHLVDADYDTGPILAQVKVPVRDGDSAETLEERVKQVTARMLKVDIADVRDESHFVRDLGAESIQSIELVAAFEEEFDVEMDQDEALAVQTVGEAVTFIEKVVAEQHG